LRTNLEHHGGYFIANGGFGTGVRGISNGANGAGVRGEALGTDAYGVMGAGGSWDFIANGPGQNYGSISSIRWKSNIVEIDNALEKVINMRGVYFNWDEEHGGQHDMGFIAEEVGKYVPEIVDYEKDGVYITGMDYAAITPVLVQAMKEQQKQIEELKAEIAELRKKQ